MAETDSDTELDEDSDLFDGAEPPAQPSTQPPTLSLEPRDLPAANWRLRWVLGVFLALVVVGLTVGIVVFNSASPGRARGAATPAAATREFLGAINRGDDAAASAISCTSFADDARAAARSGHDPGISFTLVKVTRLGKNHADAEFAQHMRIGASVQNASYRISLERGSSRWLVCGRG